MRWRDSSRWFVHRRVGLSLLTSVIGGLLVLLNPPLHANCPSRGELLDRVKSLETALKRVSEAPADTRALSYALSVHDTIRRPLGNLFPHPSSLMQAYRSQINVALEQRNPSDLTALAQAFLSSTRQVRSQLSSSQRPLVTVSIESTRVSPGEETSVTAFIRHPPRRMAGFDVEVRHDSSVLEVTGAQLASGRGAARPRKGEGTVRFNGILLRSFLSRAPPDVLPLGTINYRASTDNGHKSPLILRLRELVDRSGDPLPAVACDGTVRVE